VDACGTNLVDDPVLGHHVTQFLLGDRMSGPARGPVGGIEDQHEVRRSRRGSAHDGLLVAVAQFDRHGVEQRAVDDGAEATVVAGERADVGDVEGGVRQSALGSLGAREFDGGGGLVEAHRRKALLGEGDGSCGLTAACVEHVAVHLARRDERGDLGLRLTDAPRGPGAQPELGSLATVGGIEQHVGMIVSHASCLSI
jgi:hypothetical protein